MRPLKMLAPLVLLVAGAAVGQAPTFQPVGTVRQVTLGIVKPTSDVAFKYQLDPPKTQEEWEAFQNNALNLAEAGNLLFLPGRAKQPTALVGRLASAPLHHQRACALADFL